LPFDARGCGEDTDGDKNGAANATTNTADDRQIVASASTSTTTSAATTTCSFFNLEMGQIKLSQRQIYPAAPSATSSANAQC